MRKKQNNARTVELRFDTLADDFVGKDACCHGGVEGIDVALHGNRCDHVAALLHKAAYALSFITNDKSDGTGQIQVIHRGSAHVSTYEPKAFLL